MSEDLNAKVKSLEEKSATLQRPDYGDKLKSLEEKLNSIADKIAVSEKQNLRTKNRRGKIDFEAYEQKLMDWEETPEAKMTVKELLTTTGSVVLPTMVVDRAILELKNWVDMRPYAKRQTVVKGSGKTATFQVLTQPTYSDWSEGSALSAADPTPSNATATVGAFGKVTQISDQLVNSSAVNFVEEVGRIHGGCIGQGILDKTVDALKAATGNVTSVSSEGFTLANVASTIGDMLADNYKPNFVVAAQDHVWTAFTTSFAVTQFYGAMNDFLMTGKLPQLFGLDWLLDPYFELASKGSAFDGDSGEVYACFGSTGAAFGWAEEGSEPIVEIYRDPRELSVYVVTHLTAGVVKIVDNACAVIKHT